MKVPDEVVVHATALFDGSPMCEITQADADFIEGIVFGQNHLKRNISRVEFGQNFSKKFGPNDFKHTVELRLIVRTATLWENPRSYIWKHLRQFELTKNDGAKVVMNRIHLKSQ